VTGERTGYRVPVLTSIVVLLALCLLLFLPSAVLANDKSTADELLEFAKGQWDSFLGMMAAALAAGAALSRSMGDAFWRNIPPHAQPPGPSEWEQYPSPPPLLEAQPGADPTVWDGEGPPPTPLNEPDCVLTTACVSALGKDDDCHELQMFRRMRDEYLGRNAQAIAVIDAYYETAPLVVAAIRATADADAAWRRLYSESIAPVVDLLDADRISEAVALALSRYEAIKRQYGVA
jgi:hypothetical protein